VEELVETKIYSLLSVDTAITVTGNVSTRIYPLTLPQQTEYPCIVYARYSGTKHNHLQGYAQLESPMIMIDCWATCFSDAKGLSTRIHTAMSNATAFAAILISDVDYYEDDLQVYHVMQDYSCWNRE
jgi:hypothetical protein